jgi:hypothetical protein
MIGQLSKDYILTKPSKMVTRLLSYALFEGRPATTKGKWINPVVFGLLNTYKQFPSPKEIRNPIFITGTGRSGSTILGIVLSMHNDIAYLNEPKAIWHTAFHEEDIIGSYTKGKAYYRLDETHATKNVIENVHRIYSWYLLFTFSSRVLDKYPEMIFRTAFLKKIFPDVKILFLYRNGWDTIYSSANWSKTHSTIENGEVHDWWGVNERKWNLMLSQLVASDDELVKSINEISLFKNHLHYSAVEWILTMKEGLRNQKEKPETVMGVRYEDLVNHPDETLKKICSFCDLKKDTRLFEYAKKTLQPVAPRRKTELPECIQKTFNKYMDILGYNA